MDRLKLAQFNKISNSSTNQGYQFLKNNNLNVNTSISNGSYEGLPQGVYAGYTYLHFAAENFDLISIIELLRQNADLVKQEIRNGRTPLHIVSGYLKIKKSDEEEKIVNYTGKLREDRFVKTLLSAQVETNNTVNPKSKDGTSHLHIACIYNHVGAVELFLNAGESVNHTTNDDHCLPGYSALHFAVRYSSLEAAELLLKHGADVHLKDSAGKSALHCTIERLMNVADFLATGKRIYVPLYKQEQDILESILEMFLKSKTAQNILDDTGLTLLHVICTFKDPTAAKNLLIQNLDVNVAINNDSEVWPGWTPLHFAACFSIKTFKLLLLRGADLNMKNAEGETPLDLCMQRYSPHVAYSILSTRDEYKKIVFTDGSTNLLETILLMSNNELFGEWLKNLVDVNISIPLDSPIWPGCYLLHLAVMNERIELDERKKLMVEVPTTIMLTRIQHGLLDYWDEIMSMLLAKRHNFRTENADGHSPLYLAVKLRKRRSVKKILKSFKLNGRDRSGLLYFHIACATGNLKAMEKLAKYIELNYNSPTKTNFEWYINDFDNSLIEIPACSTPLHIAVVTKNVEVLEYLLNKDVDMFLKDADGLDPVELSMINGYYDMTRMFLEKMPVSSEFSSVDSLQYNLHLAVICNDEEAIKEFLTEGNNPKIWRPFEPVCPELRMEFSDEIGKTPLQIAMSCRLSDAVTALFDKSVHILDKNQDQLLKLAIKYGYYSDEHFITQMKQKERSASEPLDETGVTLLHIATEEHDVEWVKDLLMRGANPNCRIASSDDDDYWDESSTPLDCLVSGASQWAENSANVIEVLKFLIEFGADVTIADGQSKTPIHVLYYQANEHFSNEDCYESVMSAIDLLLKGQRTYEINPVDPHGLSHFHLACSRNQLDIVKSFLICGFELDHAYNPFAEVERHAGYTPLHFALEKGNLDVARLLIEHGANVNAEDLRGDTPLHVALKQGFVDDGLIELMLRYGGSIHAKNVSDYTPIESLVMREGFTLQQFNVMLKHGAEIDLINTKPTGSGFIGLAMLNAESNDRPHIFKRIMNACDVKNVKKQGGNVIDSAVNIEQKGQLTFDFYLDVIEQLVDAGCDPDQQDREGKTALHRATSLYNYEAVNALILIGANLNVIDKNGESPLTKEVISDNENSRRDETLDFLCSQILKALSIGLYVNESANKAFIQVTQFISSGDIFTMKPPFCLELDEMGMIFINKTSLKSFLSDTKAVIQYSRMSELERQAIGAFFKCRADIRKKFPEWAAILMMQHRKAVARTEMLKPAMDVIFQSGIKLPALCLYEILQYLNYDEVKLLVREF